MTAFWGRAPDPNQFGFEVPCEQRQWTITSNAGGVVGDWPGCVITLRPTAADWYKVDFAARDGGGATGTDTLWVRAVQWGATDLPYAAIYSPPEGALFLDSHDDTLLLGVSAVSGTGVDPSVRWVVRNQISGNEYEVGNQPTLSWTPSSSNVFDDTGVWDLRVEVTDANGTSVDQVELTTRPIIR